MRVCLITRGLPSHSNPLLGIFELDQAIALRNIKHNVVFIKLDFRSIFSKRKFGTYTSKYNDFDVFNISLPLGNLEHPLFQFLAKLYISFSINAYLNYFEKPDIIHSHFFTISNLAIVIKKKLKRPLVVTEHSSQLNKPVLPKRVYNIAKYTYSNSDLIIVVSNALQKSIFDNFLIKSVVVPNIVNVIDFPNVIDFKTLNKGDNFTFISVGSLNKNKGFDTLINAFYKANFDENVHLLIIGDGEELQDLKELIKHRKLNSRVFLLGFQTRTNIFSYFLNSDVFILASRSETFGVAFIEALYCGLPVIATYCGGPEDFIDSSNGILVPVDNISALAEAMIFMYNNSRRIYIQSEIREKIMNRFSSKVVSEKLTELYIQLINTK